MCASMYFNFQIYDFGDISMKAYTTKTIIFKNSGFYLHYFFFRQNYEQYRFN